MNGSARTRLRVETCRYPAPMPSRNRTDARRRPTATPTTHLLLRKLLRKWNADQFLLVPEIKVVIDEGGMCPGNAANFRFGQFLVFFGIRFEQSQESVVVEHEEFLLAHRAAAQNRRMISTDVFLLPGHIPGFGFNATECNRSVFERCRPVDHVQIIP